MFSKIIPFSHNYVLKSYHFLSFGIALNFAFSSSYFLSNQTCFDSACAMYYWIDSKFKKQGYTFNLNLLPVFSSFSGGSSKIDTLFSSFICESPLIMIEVDLFSTGRQLRVVLLGIQYQGLQYLFCVFYWLAKTLSSIEAFSILDLSLVIFNFSLISLISYSIC